MYELIILTLLMRGPMHGYLIAKVTNDQIGPWAKLSSGTMYTILARLEADGLIEAVPDGGADARRRRGHRRARTFAITELGRKQFHQIMMDTSSNLGDYQRLFLLKFSYLDLLTSEERLLLLNHYVNYCQTTILHLQTEMDNIVHELAGHPNEAYPQSILEVMGHVARQWEAEREWVSGIRDRELAARNGAAPRGTGGQLSDATTTR
jgi:DNA-binding PadR family transcriptional regulator